MILPAILVLLLAVPLAQAAARVAYNLLYRSDERCRKLLVSSLVPYNCYCYYYALE
jgi:hypothetical protein